MPWCKWHAKIFLLDPCFSPNCLGFNLSIHSKTFQAWCSLPPEPFSRLPSIFDLQRHHGFHQVCHAIDLHTPPALWLLSCKLNGTSQRGVELYPLVIQQFAMEKMDEHGSLSLMISLWKRVIFQSAVKTCISKDSLTSLLHLSCRKINNVRHCKTRQLDTLEIAYKPWDKLSAAQPLSVYSGRPSTGRDASSHFYPFFGIWTSR